MSTLSKVPIRFVRTIAALVLVMLHGCGRDDTVAPLNREDAAQRLISTRVEAIWSKADQARGLRVNQLERLLPAGTRVRPARTEPGEDAAELTCKNDCWLFLIDLDPLAHFAHPVRIVAMEATTGKQQEIAAQWWPLVDNEPVLSKLGERTAPEGVIFDKTPELKPEAGLDLPPGKPFGMHDPCDAWAVIVTGFDDLPDTFDEDTNGIYGVLTGLGIADDHIFYVSPHTGDAGVDRATSIANVQWAINQVAAQADETDKVLFFYSSHGGVDSLECVPGSPGGGSISASDLDSWLDTITADELTVVIEACHSGSLIGQYADGTYVAAEDDLTGDGETNRAIFTSASSDTSSSADVDDASDPNPGDSGSETIWGYIEAFGTAAADTNGDGEISFAEGWQYAWDNDVTRIHGWNTPQRSDTGLVAANVYNYCWRITGDADLFVADGPGDVGHNSHDYDSTDIWVTQDPADTDHQDAVSGATNYVHVAVHNRGTTPIAAGTLKVYWGNVSTATAWPTDFNQIGTTDSFGALAAGADHTNTWTWYVDPSIGLGHNFCLIAVADSPDDPMTGGPPGVTYVAPYDNNIAQKNITIVESHGTGHGSFQFVLANNSSESQTVDLVAEWVGRPWGDVLLLPPKDLLAQVKEKVIGLTNMKLLKRDGDRPAALALLEGPSGRLKGIRLNPGERRVITVEMQSERRAVGQRSELRLRQEAGGEILGALTAQLRLVSPSDCDWVMRTSVEAFTDLAARLGLEEAKAIGALFAERLAGCTCSDNAAIMKLLGQAHEQEIRLLEKLPASAPEEARKAYAKALRELGVYLEHGRPKTALRAQGMLALVVSEL
jgi:hypothetical protein